MSKKVGKAVVRNRVRRRLREIYRAHEEEIRPGWDLVLLARKRAVETSFEDLDRTFVSLAGRAGALGSPLPSESRTA